MGTAKARGGAKKKADKPLDVINASSVAERAQGRCECTGQCGSGHTFLENAPPVRCRAPHGCNIVRMKDNPSFWVLAPIQGFKDKDDRGPYTADKDGLVRRGRNVWELAYPDLYDLDRMVQVWLEPTEIAGALLMVCKRCKVMAERQEKKP